ncbi:hypothetical protein [Pedobacter nyackensis]|uniref:Uncharacterized protein n=1 Tax=Pedobacter nyackensis TaxID=475255 RepID=A0A1W2EG54_9SPHI|nr:hypothetical protein [Pedobacter nyackensis]SMD08720.1 hypothetical protein SAMN04488101_11259 [Pedobacter nyackensis]
MYENERAAFGALTELLSEIADYKRKLYPTVNQRAFLIKQTIANAIASHQSNSDNQIGGQKLDSLEKNIADIKSEINTTLIPLFEQLGDQARLKLVIGVMETLDHLQSLIDSKPRLSNVNSDQA